MGKIKDGLGAAAGLAAVGVISEITNRKARERAYENEKRDYSEGRIDELKNALYECETNLDGLKSRWEEAKSNYDYGSGKLTDVINIEKEMENNNMGIKRLNEHIGRIEEVRGSGKYPSGRPVETRSYSGGYSYNPPTAEERARNMRIGTGFGLGIASGILLAGATTAITLAFDLDTPEYAWAITGYGPIVVGTVAGFISASKVRKKAKRTKRGK